MCPFVLLTFFFSVLLMLVELTAAVITVTFNPSAIQLHEGQSQSISLKIQLTNQTVDPKEIYGQYQFYVDHTDVADLDIPKVFTVKPTDIINKEYNTIFNVTGKFLGYSQIRLKKAGQFLHNVKTNKTVKDISQLTISVVRDKTLISKLFVYSVIIVVSISYINMGCALDMNSVYEVLRFPIAPAIGLFSQYICMPLISFVLTLFLFDNTYFKLALFIFGCSPGGGASNMWAVILGGNLNLSITMTFLSTLFSFGLMPFWLFTLGRTIYEGTSTKPPTRNIFSTLGSMVIFLGIGLLIKRFLPRTANVCRKILAPFSGIMIIFIIIFGTISNLYLFHVMTWEMFLATAINVWFGMLIGASLSFIFKRSFEDMIAIAIETGIQNTGVTIVVLSTLPQPDADLATAVPVAASIMTPIPLTVAYLCIKLHNCYKYKYKMQKLEVNSGYDSDFMSKSNSNASNIHSNENNSETNSVRTSNTVLVKDV